MSDSTPTAENGRVILDLSPEEAEFLADCALSTYPRDLLGRDIMEMAKRARAEVGDPDDE